MDLDWRKIDRWIMGEAWTGARIAEHLEALCERIGPRWASSAGEFQAVNYLREQLQASGVENAVLEEFQLETWEWKSARAQVVESGKDIDLLPFNRCPPFEVQAPIVDAGYGTAREIDRERHLLEGGIGLMHMAFEPFTPPLPRSAMD